jgi:hypothetical protein
MPDDPRRLTYLPWPAVMKIADKLDAQGFRQLAREARKAVWDEAMLRWSNGDGGRTRLPDEPTVTVADLRYVMAWLDKGTLTEFKADADGARLFALATGGTPGAGRGGCPRCGGPLDQDGHCLSGAPL